MKVLSGFLTIAALLLLLPGASSAAPEGIPILYMDAHGRRPESFSATMARTAERGEYSRAELSRSDCTVDGRAGEVVLLVDEMVYDGIQANVSRLQSDLEAEGYTVLVWQISGGSAFDIRADLIFRYGLGELVGAICLGDIPTGWVESGYGEYPMDVYLMDMNGTWTDSDSDGLYESWTSWEPEIWVGRLTPAYVSFGSSVDLLNNYLDKNHAYRTGALTLPDRALAYEEAFTGLTGYLSLLYDDVTTVDDPVETCADDFKAELLYGYEWVHLISHSSPWGSSFHTGAPPEGAGTLNSFEVPLLNPNTFFYVLNCCSNGRWTEIDNLANTYIWCDDYGLAALAQAKVDYTNDFQEYYNTLASGSTLGDAFVDWLAANMSMEHAAVLLGDPTLRPRMNASLAATAVGSHTGEPGEGSDAWLTAAITDGLHTQGVVDSWYDPVSGECFAVSVTSDPVRANVLATHSDGDTWVEPVIVCEHEYWDWHPAVAGDGLGSVWAAWQSMRVNHETYDIFVSQWNGSGWGSELQLTAGDPFEVEPAMGGGNGHVWLVWQKWTGGSCDIEGTMWTGSTWTTPSLISDGTESERHPDVCYGSGRFGLAYQAEGAGGGWEIRFRDAPDSGPFGAEEALSAGSGEECRFPAISCDQDGFFWVVWQQSGGQVVCTRETSGGWTTPETVSGPDYAVSPDVVALPGTDGVMVSWTADGSSVRYSVWEGSSWSAIQTAVSGEAIDRASLALGGEGEPWALFGLRGADLQWDLWAARPDPTGLEPEGEGGAPGAPLSIALAGPNPSRASTAFLIEAPGPVELRIVDISGRVLLSDSAEPGIWTWSGVTSSGEPVPRGVYFAIIRSGLVTEPASCRLVRLSD